MGINKGKFFDAKLTANYFDGNRCSVNKYGENASNTHGLFEIFNNEPTFMGEMAKEVKAFIYGAVGHMLTELTEVQDTMVVQQNYIMENFESMVDPAPNARIEFDTLEVINMDFKRFYESFVNHSNDVERLVEGLNSEFGSYAYFRQPNSQIAKECFETLCGGDCDGAGHIRNCQNKLVEFDDAMLSYLKSGDVMDRYTSMENRIHATEANFSSFSPSVSVASQETVSTIVMPSQGGVSGSKHSGATVNNHGGQLGKNKM